MLGFNIYYQMEWWTNFNTDLYKKILAEKASKKVEEQEK